LFVELSDLHRETGYVEAAKEHLQLCENTLGKALKGGASMWLTCEGGPVAVEAFLGEKGNAALKLDQGPYAALKKEFALQFNALDAPTAKVI
jgi:hypothetical protein